MMALKIGWRLCGRSLLRAQLEMMEIALTVRDGDTHRTLRLLTTADWTQTTFINYIVERNPDAEAATRSAGALLYKMMIHYGSFPFPPERAQRMTCGTLLRGIYMMSRMKNRIIWRDYGILREEPPTRKRTRIDDVRLLFQSMASNTSSNATHPTQRSEDDDEDLNDVLFIVMEVIRKRRFPRIAFRRHEVLPAAALLPSSLSRSLDGKVSVQDLLVLFELVVGLLKTRIMGTMSVSSSAATECIIGGFFHQPQDASGITWDNFRDVILESFVR
jgi:hypothetical protein